MDVVDSENMSTDTEQLSDTDLTSFWPCLVMVQLQNGKADSTTKNNKTT